MTLHGTYKKLENDCSNLLTVDPNPPDDLKHFSLILRLENTRWGVVQRELMPELRIEIGPPTSKLEKVITRWCRNRRDKLMIWPCAPAEIDVRSEAITPNRAGCPSRSLAPGVLQEAQWLPKRSATDGRYFQDLSRVYGKHDFDCIAS